MISSITTVIDPDSGPRIEVPVELLLRLNRATELIEGELGHLVERFRISAAWTVRLSRSGRRDIELHLSVAQPAAAEVASEPISEERFRDDENTLRAIRPSFIHLAQTLEGIIAVQFEKIRELRKRTREAVATAVEA